MVVTNSTTRGSSESRESTPSGSGPFGGVDKLLSEASQLSDEKYIIRCYIHKTCMIICVHQIHSTLANCFRLHEGVGHFVKR